MVDWLYVYSIMAFVVALIAIILIDRKNITRDSILILRKTKRGKKFLSMLGKRFPRGLKFIGMAGVFVTFAASVYSFYFLLNVVVSALIVRKAIGSLSLVLPSPTPNAVMLPGVFGIPFWHMIISLAILVVVHEGSHGLMAVRERVPIKSLGWGLLLVIPLAFVEPNEKVMEKRGDWPQLRIFAAGSFANFIVAGFVLLISFPLLLGLFTPAGVGFIGYDKGYPAEHINLTGVITEINGQDVKTTGDLASIMKTVHPGEVIKIVTKDRNGEGNIVTKTYELTTAERLDDKGKPTGEAYMGIKGVLDGNDLSRFFLPAVLFINPDFDLFFSVNAGLEAYYGGIKFLLQLLSFLFIINFGVGLVNMLPVKPLDGGKMWEIIFKRVFPKRSGEITRTVGYITLLLIISAFVIPNVVNII